MKTILSILLAGVVSTATAQVLDTAENVAHKAVRGAKNTAETVAQGTKNAAHKVADALTPDSDARRVDVTMTDNTVDMPTQLEPGKTAFVVKNTGKSAQNFQVKGQGVNRKFMAAPDPGQTKVLHVNLKKGTYTAAVANPDNNKRTGEVTLHVK